jgi:hypothetical protein
MSSNILQRMVLYGTLGLLLSVMGFDVFAWQFWSIAALFWASEFLTRRETEEYAMAKGIAAYLNMGLEKQNEIKRIHREAQRNQDQ